MTREKKLLEEIKKKYLDWFNTDLDGAEFRKDAEKTLYSIGEALNILNEPKEFFNIPSMCISRDDLSSRFEGTDNFSKMIKAVEKITDEDMQSMAENMTGMMMEDYWVSLDTAYENLVERKKRGEEQKNE